MHNPNDMSGNTRTRDRVKGANVCFYGVLALVAVAAVFIRTIHIADLPGWFRDEGNYYAVCESIARGDTPPRLGPINITFCSPFMTQPPFYFYTGAAWLRLTAPSLASLRLFNVALSLLTLSLLFCLAKRYIGKGHALAATAMCALQTDAVIFSRMILPYNLYMLLALLTLFLALEYYRQPRAILMLGAALAAALAALTVFYAVSLFMIMVPAIALRRRWKDLPLLLIPPAALGAFLLYQYINKVPGFTEDCRALLDMAQAGGVRTILRHYYEFLTISPFYLFGVLGIVFLPRKNLMPVFVLLACVIMLFPVMRKADTIIRFVIYPVTPLMPLLCLGFGSWVAILPKTLKAPPRLKALAQVLAVVVFLVFMFNGYEAVNLSARMPFIPTPLTFAMVRNTEDARLAAAYVNELTEPGDLVVASYNVWHLLEARTTNIPISLAYHGVRSDFFMYDIAQSRFSYEPGVENADCIILDFITSQMARAAPGTLHYPVRCMVESITASWKRVARFGDYEIYVNPSRESDG